MGWIETVSGVIIGSVCCSGLDGRVVLSLWVCLGLLWLAPRRSAACVSFLSEGGSWLTQVVDCSSLGNKELG